MFISVVIVMASAFAAFHYLSRTASAADPVTITVNTLVDQDGTGAECSLREAAEAARTALAYGGCVAGTGVGDTILLSVPGIYEQNVALSNDISLVDTSIEGLTPATTTLKNFQFTVSGDIATDLSNLTIATDSVVDPDLTNLDVLVYGSNKSFTGVTFTGDQTIRVLIGDEILVEATRFNSIASNTLPSFEIYCPSYEFCSDVAVDGSTLTSAANITINTGDQTSVTNSTLTTTANANIHGENQSTVQGVTMTTDTSTDIELGENGLVDETELITQTNGANGIDVGAGSILNAVTQRNLMNGALDLRSNGDIVSAIGITQIINEGGNAIVDVDAAVMQDVSINAHAESNDNASTATVRNEYAGAEITDLLIDSNQFNLTTTAESINGVTAINTGASTQGSVYLINNQSDAIIENLELVAHVPYLTLNGDNILLRDSLISSVVGSGGGSFSVTGASPIIRNFTFEGGNARYLTTTGLALIEDASFTGAGITGTNQSLTIRDSDFSEIIGNGALSGTYSGTVTLEGVDFDNNSGSISITGSGPNAHLLLSNVNILNGYTDFFQGSPCVMTISNFVTTVLDTVEIANNNNACGAAMNATGGTSYEIKNSSIHDNNSPGLYIPSSNASVTVEDTVINNNTGAVYVNSGSTKTARFTNVEITNNNTEHTANGPPCTFLATGFSSVTLEDSVVTGNNGDCGGIVGITGGTGTHSILDTVITDNSLNAQGLKITGGNPTVTMKNSSIENGSGGMLIEAAELEYENISLSGWGASVNVGSASIKNSYFDSNTHGITLVANQATVDNVMIDASGTVAGSHALDFMVGVGTIRNTTVSGSASGDSSAVNIERGIHSLDNVTIVDNDGGGLSVVGTSDDVEVTLTNSTVAYNDAGTNVDGAGIAALNNPGDTQAGVVTLRNSLVFANTGATQCITESGSTVSAVKTISTDDSCGTGASAVPAISNSIATSVATNSSVAPALGYQAADGKVQTLALLSGSPAIAFGDTTACPAFDARGVERVAAQGCDAGAFQYGTVAVTNPEVTPIPGVNNGGNTPSADLLISQSGSTGNASDALVTEDADKTDEASPATPVLENDDTSSETDVDETETADEAPTFIVWILIGVAIVAGLIIASVIARRRQV